MILARLPYLQAGKHLGKEVKDANDAVHQGNRHREVLWRQASHPDSISISISSAAISTGARLAQHHPHEH